MIESAIGVFAAAPKTAASPTPAPSSSGMPSSRASTLPKAAPTKNSGVTSPPRKPAASVTTVNDSFSANAAAGSLGSENARTIVGTPRPK